MNDLKFAFRQLLKNPGFTAVAVLTLALGIGATTAIFSVINGVMLKPLPYDQSDQLVQLWEDNLEGKGQGRNTVSGPAFTDWKEQNSGLENLAAYATAALNLTGEGRPERLRGLRVSASYLRVLRVKPLLGRGFTEDEDQPGKDKVVLLTHGLWQRCFGGDTKLVGRTVRLGGEGRTVIGILPPKPTLAPEREFFVPLVLGNEARARNRGDHWLRVIARLKPWATVEQARAELNAITLRRNQVNPSVEQDAGAVVVPLQEQVTGEIRPKLLILFGAVGLVLMIACANVAGLLLARAAVRQKEMALRAALGAGRWRIVRQLLTESVLLSLLGGGAGLLLAWWGMSALGPVAGPELPQVDGISFDARVLGFALLASLGTGLEFGLAPARQLARPDLNEALKEGGRTSRTGSGCGLRAGLIVGEIAVTLMLLVGSGLLLKSLLRLQAVSPGFNPQHVLVMSLSPDNARYPDGERRAAFCSQIVEHLESLPGVLAAGIAGNAPMGDWNNTFIRIESRADQPESGYSTDYDYIGGNYFRALGIPVLKGRAFLQRDNLERAPRAAILSESLARKTFPSADPVGRRVQAFGEGWEVVGVVGDVRAHGLESTACERIYLPQVFCNWSGNLVVRTKVPPLTLAESVRDEILALDPSQPVANVRTLEQIMTGYLAERRLMLAVLGIFTTAALVLAAVGLYGIMAYSVSQRTREIGIRMALGAQRADVLLQVVRQGLKLTILGVALGLVGAFALTRVLVNLLFGVTARDPATFGGVTLLLGAVALLACWLPARRAAKVDPIEALRQE